MESSRIFVRGLPPNMSEADFKKHFSRNQSITDAKFMPNRRIGYVGYKTSQDAAKAVKYFNKTFIRMSKIGVEIARPVNEESPSKSHGHEADSRARQRIPKENLIPEERSEKSLKRKRESGSTAEKDEKLQEYLKAMRPPSKSKTWGNEDATAQEFGANFSTEEVVVPALEAPSEDEYQSVPEMTKNPKKMVSAKPETEKPSDNNSCEKDLRVLTAAVAPTQAETSESVNKTGAATDDEWLRSRTSRLLGLVDDDELDGQLEAQTRSITRTEESTTATNPIEKSDIPSPIAPPAPENEEVEATSPAQPAEDPDIILIEETRRLFIRNLPYGASEDDLSQYFSSKGELSEVHIPTDSKGSGKGFAYVVFIEATAAIQAYKELDRIPFQGRLLHIIPATAKKANHLDEYAISKLPLKKQKQIRLKAEASSSTFNWNSMYMNADAVMSSMSERLGVAKSDLLDPTSTDAAVRQAHAETHIIQETKSYFTSNGVDLNAFQKRDRGDRSILVKNFSYNTTPTELRNLFGEFGEITKFLIPSTGTIAIVEFAQPTHCRAAFASLAYRKLKDSILFLEKAPKNLFTGDTLKQKLPSSTNALDPKTSSSDLLARNGEDSSVETSTLFVRNLNFTTTSERLTEVFESLKGLMSARVKTKPDPKKPGQSLSMGFGFLEFRTKQDAQAALSAMDGYELDGHRLSINASHKGIDAAEERRKEDRFKKSSSKRTKIIIKNLPFEANKKDVRALFGAYGQLRSIRVPKKFDSSARGFAFADFVTAREAENAMEALRDSHFLGRRLVLDFTTEDALDAEEEIKKMQKKVGGQTEKVALQKLMGSGRKKFNVEGGDDINED